MELVLKDFQRVGFRLDFTGIISITSGLWPGIVDALVDLDTPVDPEGESGKLICRISRRPDQYTVTIQEIERPSDLGTNLIILEFKARQSQL